ncbi:hypothetical protein DOTSEDRAFT_177289 [Dothistroma septosporum NZE10]|uniref:Ribosomal protein L9 domain-containing protein n=1 Tax=Dothistroma septosporum (strain NZE10 / CBS 128990) TaxID=675120 RepID=N1PGZ0_DOTSN|nr:hypothetical protein DOTSEDRAFT_177289 [Dothistroma septosporum NZE10]
MASPLRTRAIPQCSACIRGYTWTPFVDSKTAPATALGQQIRGKKKLANLSGTRPARLLKDVPGYGRRGAIIPVATGEMRNKFFPRRIAEYVTLPELRTIKANNIPIARDYAFGKEELLQEASSNDAGAAGISITPSEPTRAPKKHEVEKLSPDRSLELLEIFVNPRLDFYRQPIIEEKESEEEAHATPKVKERQRTASSAAADLLAARMQAPKEPPKPFGPQAIYGSVSTHDILVAARAAIAENDEAARVILAESDIRFMDEEARTEGKVKHVGDFTIEIKVKGAERGVKRTVRVVPQEA